MNRISSISNTRGKVKLSNFYGYTFLPNCHIILPASPYYLLSSVYSSHVAISVLLFVVRVPFACLLPSDNPNTCKKCIFCIYRQRRIRASNRMWWFLANLFQIGRSGNRPHSGWIQKNFWLSWPDFIKRNEFFSKKRSRWELSYKKDHQILNFTEVYNFGSILLLISKYHSIMKTSTLHRANGKIVQENN